MECIHVGDMFRVYYLCFILGVLVQMTDLSCTWLMLFSDNLFTCNKNPGPADGTGRS